MLFAYTQAFVDRVLSIHRQYTHPRIPEHWVTYIHTPRQPANALWLYDTPCNATLAVISNGGHYQIQALEVSTLTICARPPPSLASEHSLCDPLML